jgi:hypothetical protein
MVFQRPQSGLWIFLCALAALREIISSFFWLENERKKEPRMGGIRG